MKLKLWVLVGGLLAAMSCDKQELAITAEEQLAHDVAAIDEFLAAHSIVAVQHVSGLRYVINVEGTGEKPTASNCVRINYHSYVLGESTPFDSRAGLGVGLSRLNLLAWQIGLKQVKKGGVITLYIPSKLGYGAYSAKISDSYTVPANSILISEIELLNITGYNSAGQYCYPWP